MENKIDITKMKAQDFMNELPEMVRSLEAVRSSSQDKKPVEVTFGELVTGKWGISEDELFEKMGINPKVHLLKYPLDAGYVTPDGTLLNDRFVKANQATSSQFIPLNPAEEANEVIQVLIK